MNKQSIEKKINDSFDGNLIKKIDLYKVVKGFFPSYNESSLRWVIHGLIQKGIITKISSDIFIKGHKKKYIPSNSSLLKKRVKELIISKFPNVKIAIYESSQLNEWVNHQVGRNIVFVEAEKYFLVDVFKYINKSLSITTLLNPSKEDLYLYDGEMVVVTSLITQAPLNSQNKEIKIEKLIVDFFSKDLIAEFVNDSEKEEVISSMFRSYAINEKKILAYAKRRNNFQRVKEFLEYIKIDK